MTTSALAGREVAELAGVTDGRFVVVNAVEYADLDVVVLGLLEAAAAGRSFLYRQRAVVRAGPGRVGPAGIRCRPRTSGRPAIPAGTG